jgi:signal transduction histidine kinase
MVESLSEPPEKALVNLTRGSKQIMKVLHVDDDLVFLRTAKSCLEMHGRFEIDAAPSVENALKKLGESEYDAIISDYQMPGRDGLELLKELRDKGNNIPFVVFTGRGREEVAIKALNLGADHYLDKHGNPETVYTELAHNIREAVEKRDMTQMLARATTTAMRDKEGKACGFVSIIRDVTERKKIEARGLENEIALMNEKLRIVGGLTRHDIRNKLSVIVGNTYLARKACDGKDEILHNLQEIDEAVQQITKMLDFAKTYELLGLERLAHFDVENAFKEATSAFPDLATVKVINDCHGLSVRADSLLIQLFHNFVDNSLKYGEKLTEIRVYYEEDADQLKLIYEDDGIGIPHEGKLRIFNEGFTTGKGSGHGLYLIRKTLEIYGWTIKESGETGKGARFVITIPKTDSSGKENYRIV